ncbi:RraA family protein [Pelagibius sp. Alg239-R121]|uniref:RraA family protein n=1 Tax=Pelagibius sp. Alg239-R121 TaxID=2993448 RepID=UPI0024A76277|nr:RraA family protein [Pelagibius sp. Alg239-R121]
MIEDPPVLTARRKIERPAPEVVSAFSGIATSNLVDALGGGGALHHSIKPLGAGDGLPFKFCGTAITALCGPSDNLALFAAVALAEPGDVIVAGTDAFKGAAVAGDLVLGMAKNKGVVAFVTDGMLRDYEAILPVGLPVYCAGLTPNSPARSGPGSVNLPLSIGGLQISPGDILAGDRDGVVVIPQARASEAQAALPALLAAETALLSEVENGLAVPGHTEALLASDRVRFLD